MLRLLSKSEDLDQRSAKSEVALRFVAVIIPATLTAHFLNRWLSVAWAAAISTFLWVWIIYWIPGRAEFNVRRWSLIVMASTFAVLLLTKLFGWF